MQKLQAHKSKLSGIYLSQSIVCFIIRKKFLVLSVIASDGDRWLFRVDEGGVVDACQFDFSRNQQNH